MKLSELQVKRSEAEAKMAAMVAERASREYNDTEEKDFSDKFDALEVEIKSLNTKITNEERTERINKQTVLNRANKTTDEDKLKDAFRFSAAISKAASGKLDGAEKEMSDEARNQARATGVKIDDRQNSFFVPNEFLKVGQKRDLTSGGAATGEELVSDDYKGHISGLHINPL